MELRTLKYFLAVAQEGNITNAAKRLHVTQPTLSRQLADLEKDLGRQLYTRGHGGIELTAHGTMLYTYASSIIELAEKAEADIRLPEQTVSGPVHIAAGETARVGIIGRTMIEVQKRYPGITLNLYSGNSADLMDGLVRGQYDFFLECEVKTHVDMNTLILPERDVWGIATRKDNPLAKLERVRPDDLVGHPLITSQQGMTRDPLRTWARDVVDQITVTATYNLPLNCRYLAESGMGSIITYGDIFEDLPDSSLVFIPLDPPIESTQGIVWRKTLPTRQAQVFLDTLRELIAAE